jgi:hypothetical protein
MAYRGNAKLMKARNCKYAIKTTWFQYIDCGRPADSTDLCKKHQRMINRVERAWEEKRKAPPGKKHHAVRSVTSPESKLPPRLSVVSGEGLSVLNAQTLDADGSTSQAGPSKLERMGQSPQLTLVQGGRTG